MKLMWRMHRFWYRISGGRVGGKLEMPVLLLTTTGRKTGKERIWPLYHLVDGDSFVVIASNAGEGRHPAWFLNLQADPQVSVQVGNEKYEVTAREAQGEERERLWKRAVAESPGYETYRTRTTRRIPVVLLERR